MSHNTDFDLAARAHDQRVNDRSPEYDIESEPEPHRCYHDCGNEVENYQEECADCLAYIAEHDEPNSTTMNTNDNFDNLWSNLKEQVKAARGYNGAVTTMGSLTSENSLRVSLSPPSKHFNPDAPWVHMSINGASIIAKARGGELLAISALCIAAALDLEEQAATKEALSQATPKP